MQAFHNDATVKAFYLDRVRAHRAADELRHGYYWENGKGCAVGCTLHASDRRAYERELGIPQVLAHLEDMLFEGLVPPYDCVWPEVFLKAIPVGADLSLVWPRLFLRMAIDPQYGLLQHVQEPRFEQQKGAINIVIAHYAQWVKDERRPATLEAMEIVEAAKAARVAVEASTWAEALAPLTSVAWAATSAAEAAAEASSWAEVEAAAEAAASTISALADAADAIAERKDVHLWQSRLLLTLLREAPIGTKESKTNVAVRE